MTKEEAIEIIDCGEISNRWGKDGEEVEKMAIEALERQPSISEDGTLTVNVEDGSKVSRVLVCGDNHFGGLYYPDQEPCDKCVYSTSEGCQYDDITETTPPFEDCISRQAVLDLVNADWKYEGLEEPINSLPPVTPQPKTGHWIKEKTLHGWDGKSYQCSECGRSIHLDLEVEELNDYPYCHCGAKMSEGSEKE